MSLTLVCSRCFHLSKGVVWVVENDHLGLGRESCLQLSWVQHPVPGLARILPLLMAQGSRSEGEREGGREKGGKGEGRERRREGREKGGKERERKHFVLLFASPQRGPKKIIPHS